MQQKLLPHNLHHLLFGTISTRPALRIPFQTIPTTVIERSIIGNLPGVASSHNRLFITATSPHKTFHRQTTQLYSSKISSTLRRTFERHSSAMATASTSGSDDDLRSKSQQSPLASQRAKSQQHPSEANRTGRFSRGYFPLGYKEGFNQWVCFFSTEVGHFRLTDH